MKSGGKISLLTWCAAPEDEDEAGSLGWFFFFWSLPRLFSVLPLFMFPPFFSLPCPSWLFLLPGSGFLILLPLVLEAGCSRL